MKRIPNSCAAGHRPTPVETPNTGSLWSALTTPSLSWSSISGGRKSGGRSRRPSINHSPPYPSRDPGLLRPLALGTAPPRPVLPVPQPLRVPEVAPQLPGLDLGPVFGIVEDEVPGWRRSPAPRLPGLDLGEAFVYKEADYWKIGQRDLEDVGGGMLVFLPRLMLVLTIVTFRALLFTEDYEQPYPLVVLVEVVAIVLVSFWLIYMVDWVISWAREKVRAKRGVSW